MSEIDDKLIKGHEYDGIQELDNPLPAWWLGTFFVTIIFGFIYWIHYSFGGGLTLVQEMDKSLAQIQSLKKSGPVQTEESLSALLSGQDLAGGKLVYEGKCAACHGAQGEGLIGPNLTDNAWIHDRGSLVGIYKVIQQGVLEKGMPAWGEQLKVEEINSVTAYVVSLKGKNIPGKPAQGEVVQ